MVYTFASICLSCETEPFPKSLQPSFYRQALSGLCRGSILLQGQMVQFVVYRSTPLFDEYSHSLAVQLGFWREVVVFDSDIGDIGLVEFHVHAPEDGRCSNEELFHSKVDAHTDT